MLLPCCDCGADVHARTTRAGADGVTKVFQPRGGYLHAVVGLVEAEKVGGSVFVGECSGLDIASPFSGVVGAVGVKHGDEFVLGVGGTVGVAVPVVGPVNSVNFRAMIVL